MRNNIKRLVRIKEDTTDRTLGFKEIEIRLFEILKSRRRCGYVFQEVC